MGGPKPWKRHGFKFVTNVKNPSSGTFVALYRETGIGLHRLLVEGFLFK
jgi:hypothetical protein